MSAIAFDTLAYAKKLKRAGVPEAQAEVQAEAMAELVEERLATKRDLQAVARVDAYRERLDASHKSFLQLDLWRRMRRDYHQHERRPAG